MDRPKLQDPVNYCLLDCEEWDEGINKMRKEGRKSGKGGRDLGRE